MNKTKDESDFILFDNEEYSDEEKTTDTTHHPWIEKYRPESLNNIISQKLVITTLKNFLKNKQLPHLLLYGPPGTGKTSVITAYAKELYGAHYDLMVLEVNASEERGIEVVRNRIIQFVTAQSLFGEENMFKLVILDEADAMTADAQAILRKVIEKYTNNARFCLICNYVKKISLALQSRFVSFRFSPLHKDDIKQKLKDTIKQENINITDEGIDTLIKRSKGDMRKIYNILQSIAIGYKKITSKIINKCLNYPDEDIILEIIRYAKKHTTKENYEYIQELRIENGFSMNDIITETFNILMNELTENKYKLDYTEKDILNILKYMREIEFNLTSCTDETIQMTTFISLFKI